jgi:hypothetical protein
LKGGDNMANLFGKSLFGYKKPKDPMWDFAQFGLLNYLSVPIGLEAYTEDLTTTRTVVAKKEEEKPQAMPKQLWEAKALHDVSFGFNVDDAYLDEQITGIQEKLGLLGKKPKAKRSRDGFLFDTESGGKKFGRAELEGILERLQNRRKIASVNQVVSKYPYTTSDKINAVITAHSNLLCEEASSFIPDFPRDAINAMNEYNKMCEQLCGRKSVFYVLAEKKQKQTVSARRDPILFAQSPFGFFWQILGAWDKEMIYLADL